MKYNSTISLPNVTDVSRWSETGKMWDALKCFFPLGMVILIVSPLLQSCLIANFALLKWGCNLNLKGPLLARCKSLASKINIYKLVTFLWQYCCNNIALNSLPIIVWNKSFSLGQFFSYKYLSFLFKRLPRLQITNKFLCR